MIYTSGGPTVLQIKFNFVVVPNPASHPSSKVSLNSHFSRCFCSSFSGSSLGSLLVVQRFGERDIVAVLPALRTEQSVVSVEDPGTPKACSLEISTPRPRVSNVAPGRACRALK